VATLATYQVVIDEPFTLGHQDQLTNDYHLSFQVPENLDTSSPAILAFRTNPDPVVTLNAQINDMVIVRQRFDTGPARSWHEVFSSSVLQEGKDSQGYNSLDFWTPRDEGEGSSDLGYITVSDVVVFFQITIRSGLGPAPESSGVTE